MNPTEREAYSRRVGVLFPENALYKHLSSLANLHLHCQIHGLPRERAPEVLSTIGMADQASALVEKLPPGLSRRVAFGRAILHSPAVLLLCDPFARCDGSSI